MNMKEVASEGVFHRPAWIPNLRFMLRRRWASLAVTRIELVDSSLLQGTGPKDRKTRPALRAKKCRWTQEPQDKTHWRAKKFRWDRTQEPQDKTRLRAKIHGTSVVTGPSLGPSTE